MGALLHHAELRRDVGESRHTALSCCCCFASTMRVSGGVSFSHGFCGKMPLLFKRKASSPWEFLQAIQSWQRLYNLSLAATCEYFILQSWNHSGSENSRMETSQRSCALHYCQTETWQNNYDISFNQTAVSMMHFVLWCCSYLTCTSSSSTTSLVRWSTAISTSVSSNRPWYKIKCFFPPPFIYPDAFWDHICV